MSIHSSLKSKSGSLSQHRNVLSRPERIAKLTESGAMDPASASALSLPKVRSIKIAAAKKPKKDPAAAVAAAPVPVAVAAKPNAKKK
ncbi:MAG: small basic protein [Planctomycetota bacterium]|nr:small basic protein [Planctomycetota bacterium]MDA1106086.1 small basic protein [Planctomycetota bacterium]